MDVEGDVVDGKDPSDSNKNVEELPKKFYVAVRIINKDNRMVKPIIVTDDKIKKFNPEFHMDTTQNPYNNPYHLRVFDEKTGTETCVPANILKHSLIREDVENPEKRYPCPSGKYQRYSDAIEKLAEESVSEKEEESWKESKHDETPKTSRKKRVNKMQSEGRVTSDSETEEHDETSRKRKLKENSDTDVLNDCDESDLDDIRSYVKKPKRTVKEQKNKQAEKKFQRKKKEKSQDKTSQLEIIKRKAQKIIEDKKIVNGQKNFIATALSSFKLPSRSPIETCRDHVLDTDVASINENVNDLKKKVFAFEKELKYRDEEIERLQLLLVTTRSKIEKIELELEDKNNQLGEVSSLLEQCIANTEDLENEKRELQERVSHLLSNRQFDKILQTPLSNRTSRRKLFSSSPNIHFANENKDVTTSAMALDDPEYVNLLNSSPTQNYIESIYDSSKTDSIYKNDNSTPMRPRPRDKGTPEKNTTPSKPENTKSAISSINDGKDEKTVREKFEKIKRVENNKHTNQIIKNREENQCESKRPTKQSNVLSSKQNKKIIYKDLIDYDSDDYESDLQRTNTTHNYKDFEEFRCKETSKKMIHLCYGYTMELKTWNSILSKKSQSPSLFVKELALELYLERDLVLRTMVLARADPREGRATPRKPFTPKKIGIIRKCYHYYLKEKRRVINDNILEKLRKGELTKAKRKDLERNLKMWVSHLSTAVNTTQTLENRRMKELKAEENSQSEDEAENRSKEESAKGYESEYNE